jgi:hypothetical protein
MTTMFKHFNSDEVPSANTPRSFPIAPTMQAIIVDRVTVINPKLASIVRNDAETIVAFPEKSHTTCPTGSEVIISSEARPSAPGVPVVNRVTPTSHVGPAMIQILAPTTLAKVEGIFHEQTSTISGSI